jgi:hypothetical protein
MPNKATCPICHRVVTEPAKLPFCSERCRKIDFFRWWDGVYAISEPNTEELADEFRVSLTEDDSGSSELVMDA